MIHTYASNTYKVLVGNKTKSNTNNAKHFTQLCTYLQLIITEMHQKLKSEVILLRKESEHLSQDKTKTNLYITKQINRTI